MRGHVSSRSGFALLAILILAAGLFSCSRAAREWRKPRAGATEDWDRSSGLLPRDHLTLESAIQVDLSKETVRLPLYKGKANGQTVWYVLLDASDAGLAHDLGVNYAPKLANLGDRLPRLRADGDPRLADAGPEPVRAGGRQLPGRTRTSAPTRVGEPGPDGFPLANVPARRGGRPGLQPVHPDRGLAGRLQRARSWPPATARSTSCTTPTPVTASSASTSRRKSPPGQFLESWVDMLFVKGFDAGQPIVYISTDAGQPLTAVLERSTYVPALDKAAYNGGDDFLGSARERLFGFINGQTGANNPQAQGFVHLVKDGHACRGRQRQQHRADQRAAQRRRPAQRVRRLPDPGGPPPRPGLQPAVGRAARPVDRQGDPARAQHAPDRRDRRLQPGRHPARPAHGSPGGAPYGSAGVDINCAVIGFTDKAPTANLAEPAPNSQFPPR